MSVAIKSVITSGASTAAIIADLDRQLTERAIFPHMVFVFYSPHHDDVALGNFLRERWPGIPIIGGTSVDGLVDHNGLHGDQPVGLLLVCDPDGMYGAAAAEIGDDPASAAEEALQRALDDAGATGELPEAVWVFQAPGSEELVLQGLQRVVGDRCPILGGSAVTDNTGTAWRQLGSDRTYTNGVAVGVLFPSGGISYAYQGGYEPTGNSGVITEVIPAPLAVNNSPALVREIVSIDGQQAAEVYDRWSEGVLGSNWRENGELIDQKSANDPLGVVVGSTEGMSYFRLVHPAVVTSAGHLRTFAAVRVGERLYSMRGSQDGLVRRAQMVVSTATTSADSNGNGVAGGLVLYCTGCRVAVGGGIDDVVSALQSGFGEREFIGCFTGGELGPTLGRNMSSNLMISALVFGS